MMPNIVAFDEPLAEGTDVPALLGGKGAGLVEMTQRLGLPVPPGFVITTSVCRKYLQSGWPQELDAEIDAHLERLAGSIGRRFGDPAAPLLVSVRSGAPVSMPGMMDTLLNVGITPEIRERLALAAGSPVFAADTWLRFCRMYAEIVLGVPGGELGPAATHDDTLPGILAAAERVRRIARDYGGIPEAPRDQLRGAIEAVFRSWNSDRARIFRQRENIAEDLGTAVTVQSMVFGNLDDDSGTGVAFTRDPATGDPEPYGDYLPRAQGEDVVAGTHAVRGLDALREQLPDVYADFRAALQRLERHYRDVCDVEFTVSEGKLYVLQTRIGRRSPLAAVRIAVQMAEDPDFPLTRADAVARIDQSLLHELAGAGTVAPDAQPVTTGLAASPGVGVGVLVCDPDRAAQLAEEGTAVVLAREQTSPADVHGMVGAAAIITTLGGVASHAAVVARSWSIPAVTSLTGAHVEPDGIRVDGEFVPQGETVTVDGTRGAVYRGDCRQQANGDIPEVRTLREWAAELSLEPGSRSDAPAAGDEGPVGLYQLARVVQLKGLCNAERAAAALGASPAAVEQAFEEHAETFRVIPRGAALTPEGRAWVQEQLAAERAEIDSGGLNSCYERFLPLNDRFKRLVTGWQSTAAEGFNDDEWSSLLESMQALHGDFRPLVEDTATKVPRLARYGPRFDHALEAMRDGDDSMLAAPLKDSYHTVWFEYHEELIALCGRNRAEEERAESARER